MNGFVAVLVAVAAILVIRDHLSAEERANLQTIWWLGMGGLLVGSIAYALGIAIKEAYVSAGDFLQHKTGWRPSVAFAFWGTLTVLFAVALGAYHGFWPVTFWVFKSLGMIH